MGGSDSYCFICGACAQVSITWRMPFEAIGVKLESIQQIMLDTEDDAFHDDLVSIGPYGDPDDRPLIDAMKIYQVSLPAGLAEAERLEAVDPKTIRIVHDLIPGEFHDMGGLNHADPEVDDVRRAYYTVDAAVYPFGHALCFRLLESWVPALMRPVGNFWMTVRKQNGLEFTNNINGLDYGDITGSMDQYVQTFHQYGDDRDEATEMPTKLAVDVMKDPLDPVDIDDFWLGQGKMYVFKRPDRFPIREAFETNSPLSAAQAADAMVRLEVSAQAATLTDLPLELILAISCDLSMRDSLRLVQLNRALRARLLPQLDALAKQQLNPWGLPTEAEKAGWADLVNESTDASSTPSRDADAFPWWSYARACWRSSSMQNRRRVYGICLQLEAIARSHHII